MPPDPPPGGKSQSSYFVSTGDPNDKLAPVGYGDGHFIAPGGSLPYTIRFENKPDATAPARLVTVSDVLDDDLDLDTFQLTEIAFAGHTITMPLGVSQYSDQMSLTVGPDSASIVVNVAANLNRATRELSLTLEAFDPETGWYSEDPTVGLLYPNNDSGWGEGSISYVVRPKAGLSSGTEIRNLAHIIFDFNDPIDTPEVLNTIDAAPPTSRVEPLPAVTTAGTVDLSWSGQDDAGGSGIASYDVYVSIDGGQPFLLAESTTETSTQVTVELGHTYSFYSIARDNVGHVEAPKSTPDAKIEVRDNVSPHVVGVYIRGSAWSDGYLAELAAQGYGAAGYAVPVGSCGQLVTVHWSNLNQIVVEFDEDVLVTANSLTLAGLNVPSYAMLSGGFSYDPATRRATWTLAQVISADKLLLSLADSVEDLHGNMLDGDWTNVLDSFPSGDGTSGRPFQFSFNVLPGDIDRDDHVSEQDRFAVIARAFGTIGEQRYDVLHDLDGNGIINVVDAIFASNHVGMGLPVGDPRGSESNPGSVVGVLLSGSTWPDAVRQLVDPVYGIGYAIPVGSCRQFDPLPWSTLNQVSIVFSDDMVVDPAALSLLGVAVPQYSLAVDGFSYDATQHIATWTFTETIPADKLRIVLSDAVQTVAGNPLDGEWLDLSRTFSSGDGTPGGDFVFRFNVLPGDVDQNLEIDEADIRRAASRFWSRPGDQRYDPLSDVTGTGANTLGDLLVHRNRQGTFLPGGEPSAGAVNGAAAGAVLVKTSASAGARLVDAVVVQADQGIERGTLRFASRRGARANDIGERHRAIDRVIGKDDATGELLSSVQAIRVLRQRRA